MSTNTPDCWVIVRLRHDDNTIDKVLAGWYGGYLSGDSWKLSSGIETTEEFDNRYEFTNYSGSIYVCYKNRERMNGIMAMQYEHLRGLYDEHMKAHPDVVATMEIIKYGAD